MNSKEFKLNELIQELNKLNERINELPVWDDYAEMLQREYDWILHKINEIRKEIK